MGNNRPSPSKERAISIHRFKRSSDFRLARQAMSLERERFYLLLLRDFALKAKPHHSFCLGKQWTVRHRAHHVPDDKVAEWVNSKSQVGMEDHSLSNGFGFIAHTEFKLIHTLFGI